MKLEDLLIEATDFPDAHRTSLHNDGWGIELTARNLEFLMEKHNELVSYILGKEVCPICEGSGLNHGVQCKPSKAHPTGWKSEKCECQEKNNAPS